MVLRTPLKMLDVITGQVYFPAGFFMCANFIFNLYGFFFLLNFVLLWIALLW